MPIDFQTIKFDTNGLIPAILQDWRDGTVLMVAYMNRQALEKTLETGRAHFWSRSRQELWEKGATSGNYQQVQQIFIDCDQDTLLLKVEPKGPACHTGEQTCFFSQTWPKLDTSSNLSSFNIKGGVIDRLYDVIASRRKYPSAESYVSSLMHKGQDRILKKITEEAGEVILGSKNLDKREIISETTDLLFHLLIVLGYHEISPQEIYHELANRYGISGNKKKKSEGSHG